ncbi:MAG TPA: SDR family oxidoreductase [Sphingomonadales bacterium]|nr:SDR family oxidoreductase [Sphingomonadales bacterium]
MSVKGKTLLVTGASRGIGAAIVEKLLADGARVVAHYNRTEGSLAALAKKPGRRLLAVRANLENDAETEALWAAAVKWQGRVHGLINNAAIISSVRPEAPLVEWRKEWRRTIRVNLDAAADLCRFALLHFLEKGGGDIVNVASRAAFRGDLPDAMHYAASKGGLVALTRSLAKNYARQGVCAYTVAPGWVSTERVMPKLAAKGNEFMLAEVPMGGPAPPAEVANIVAFLLSGAARHATGGTFDINGASYFH